MRSLLGWSDMSVAFPQRKMCRTRPSLCPVSQPCCYPLFLTSPFSLSCLLALSWRPLILARTICVTTGLERGMRTWWAHLSVHHWRKRHCFLHRAFIPPFWGLQTITETGRKERQSRREMLSSGRTLYKQSHSSCGCMHRACTRLDLLTTDHGLGKGPWSPSSSRWTSPKCLKPCSLREIVTGQPFSNDQGLSSCTKLLYWDTICITKICLRDVHGIVVSLTCAFMDVVKFYIPIDSERSYTAKENTFALHPHQL